MQRASASSCVCPRKPFMRHWNNKQSPDVELLWCLMCLVWMGEQWCFAHIQWATIYMNNWGANFDIRSLGVIGNIVKCYASLYCATSCQRHVIFHDVGLFTLLFCLRKCEFHRDANWRVSSGRWKRPEICHQLLLDSISSPSLYSGMYFWPFGDHNIQCFLSVSSRYS